ncbi:MAG: hypothetical protein JXR94_20125 [Candidatus Hydrogenedentes bacterium]|nr:hypothetical protein [Candidatus Hydrogenedentota bacterium]
MKDAAYLHRALSRGVRALALFNIALTAAFVLLVAWSELMPERPIEADGGLERTLSDSIADAPISAADVKAATAGKAVFRTSRATRTQKIDELGSYRLMGILVRRGEPRAYFRDIKRKQTLTKRVGEMLGTYEVVDITNEGVLVRRGGQEVLIPKG